MSATTPTGTTPAHDDFTESIRESAEATGPVTQQRANGFYDRLRDRIHAYVEGKGTVAEKSAEYLMLVPDVFMLLWRLTNDPRVNSKNKVLLGSGLAYYLFPLDIVPEAILGPIGFVDDLVFGVYILNKMLMDTDPDILRQHWSGEDDVLEAMQRVLNAADTLVAGELMPRLKKLIK
jgi:uncharacterized membrane protein YkvA (DUF1232 family)